MEEESMQTSENDAVRAGLSEDISPSRDKGDTAPVPHRRIEAVGPKTSQLFIFHVELDLMQWLLFLVALATRMWRLDHPREIVFDELHYGRFTAMYQQRKFFYDQNPPLGKLLLTLGACVCGFDGNYKFERIGADYSPDVPVFCMRVMPALFGCLLVPVAYQLIVELQLSRWTAVLAGCLVIFDNALLTQSRFMLMESFLIFFIVLSVLCLVKFTKLNQRCPFSVQWWIWLALLGVSMACAVSVKYIGLMTVVLVLLHTARDYWKMLADRHLSDMQLVRHLLARVGVLLVVPTGVYLSIFYVHLSILTKAGPHDDIMTSAFQASLEGGLAAITRGQPYEVAYGSQVTLRHTHSSRPCWLHSHPEVYPLRYPDGRGSSHQQQVTCYFYKDVNNWWIIKDPNRNSLMVDDPVRLVKHGDIVQLIHGTTSRALNSHDVAAPLSPDQQEVTCYIDYNISTPAQSLWRVEILNHDTDGATWKTIRSHVCLTHLNTSQALKISGKQLPEWGFHQLEVVTDKLHDREHTLWNVEEHRYTRSEDEEERGKGLSEAELFPLHPTQLGFFWKFWELQMKMLHTSQSAPLEHRYSSGPLDWLLMDTNIAFWINPRTNAQIHLLGNPVTWYCATLAVLVYVVLLTFYLIRRHRCCYDISQAEWHQFVWVGEVGCGGYFLHYLPHFLSDAPFFLHHYLPAYVFSLILLAFLIQHVYALVWSSVMRNIYQMLLLVWVTAVVNIFVTFSVFSYGNSPLSEGHVKSLQWKDTWDFIAPARHLVDTP